MPRLKIKKLSGVLLPAVLCLLILLSSCGFTDMLDPFGREDDVFDPLSMNTIREPDFVEHTVSRLLYEELPEKEKQAYRRIYNSVFSQPAKILLPALSEEELTEVLSALKFDNPHVLCLKNEFTYYDAGSKFYLLPEYYASAEECGEMTRQLLASAEKICSEIPQDSGEYEKELYLHDELARLVEYGTGERSDTAYGALVDLSAACGGYALACKLLFDVAGIKSAAVSGKVKNENGEKLPHMWLAAQINGEWFFVDPTWDDPIGSGENDTLRHTYFNIPETVLAKTHYDYSLPGGIRCDSEKEDYYLLSDLLLEDDNWETVIGDAMKSVSGLPAHLEFRFAEEALFRTAAKKLFDSGGLAEMIKASELDPEKTALSHSFDSDRNILHIYIKNKAEE